MLTLTMVVSMEYIDRKNNIIWNDELLEECERLWNYFVSINVDPAVQVSFNKNGLNAVGWLVYNGYSVETFTLDYNSIPVEWVLELLLP